MFTREDWTLFRNLSTLGQKAGVPREGLAALVLKELVDNALDAGAECTLTQNGDTWAVTDNGPGIPGTDEEVAALFSIKRPLTSSKLLRLPTRGALGNGLRVVAGAVLASGGNLQVGTRGRILMLYPQDDGTTTYARVGSYSTPGTRVLVTFGRELQAARNAADMARLAIRMRGESAYVGLSSPWWYDSDSFYELLQAAGETSVQDVCGHLLGGNKVSNATGASTLSRTGADALLEDLRDRRGNPAPAKLGVVGELAYGCHGYAKKTAVYTIPAARGKLSAQIPVVVEVWASKLERDSSPAAYVYVNRTPITARVSSGMRGGKSGEQWVVGCGLNHYFKTGRSPMKLSICVTSPYMPITTDGKEPNLKYIIETVKDAITAAAGKAKRATSESRTNGYGDTKQDLVYMVLERAIADASGRGKHRFSLRQLYYACRPLLASEGMSDVDNEMKYTYFSTLIGKYEAEIGRDVPGMYRDSRGALQHPHMEGQIPLGTLSIEAYKRPKYRFNKVLYVEKGGFMPLLLDAKWGERHDCAVFTSQGFASRAARDLLDLLGDTNEELEFFCIHDADSAGGMIYQALVEGTLARPGRRVKVVNLGLDPWEAEAMGLQSEGVQKKSTQAVAGYVQEYDRRNRTSWATWLQENRYELNAMTSPQFLTWLDRKMEEHSENTKVVPPFDVLSQEMEERVNARMHDAIVAELVEKYDVKGQVLRLLANMERPVDLDDRVRALLADARANPWETPLGAIAEAEAARLLAERV